ncbi:hypothetical protein BpHYR1_039750 [Brachionus plicatilis]|uniref:Uncharacterized protein n=1 Tax=Brachionus plicatilis TaxID=10195 RepID=A0A3M7QJ43_BRAPC|nr:hypothetical protein BpHYR1_039750 [Brachionus plicatilis]
MDLRNSLRLIQSYNSILDTIVEWPEQNRNKTAKILYEEGNFLIPENYVPNNYDKKFATKYYYQIFHSVKDDFTHDAFHGSSILTAKT